MLQDAHSVAHRPDRDKRRCGVGYRCCSHFANCFADYAGKLAGDCRPGSLAAAQVGPVAQGRQFLRVGEKLQHRVSHGLRPGIAQEHAHAIGQKFAGMDKRGRYHRPPQRHGIGKGAGCDLGKIGIGCEIDVAQFDLVEQVRQVEEAVLPGDTAAHSKAGGQVFQAAAIGLAFMGHQVGMGCADYPVQRVGVALDNCRERADGGLQPRALPDKPECGQHRARVPRSSLSRMGERST